MAVTRRDCENESVVQECAGCARAPRWTTDVQ